MQTTINSPKSQLLKYFELDKYKNQSIIQQVTRSDGSMTITVYNAHATVALSANFSILFTITG